MKKITLLLAVLLLVLVGCGGGTPADQTCPAPTVYTIEGENDQFTVSGGRISLNDGTPCNEKETLEGGMLSPKDERLFTDVTAMNGTIYVMDKDERHDILACSRKDESGGTVPVKGAIGTMSGSGSLLGTKLADGKDLAGKLFCDVTTTHSDGTTRTSTIPLTLTKAN